MGKIDHYFSSATTLSGSYSFDDASVSVPDDFDLKIVNNPVRRQNAVLSLQHVFSPTVVNIARVGISRTFVIGRNDGSPRNPALADKSLGFLPGQNMGNIIISGVSGIYGGIGSGLGQNAPNVFGYTTPQVYNDLSLTKGRHNIRLGFSLERVIYNANQGLAPTGRWTFNSIQRFLQGTPDQFAGDIPGTDVVRGFRTSIIAGYIQDDIKVRSNLTFNVGMRYEMGTVISEVNGKIANLRNLRDSTITVGGPLYHNPTLKNFAPRIGFAWDPSGSGKTSIRAGFGMFDIIPLPYILIARLPQAAPFNKSGQVNAPPAATFPNTAYQLFTATSGTAAHIEFEPRRAYRAQWNFNIQRQLTRDLALTVGYVGSAGVHLPNALGEDVDQVPPSLVRIAADGHYVFPIPATGTAIQRINPNFARITSTEWSGHSSYHGLQTNLVQRPLKGLSYQVAYTWSKSIDNGSITFAGNENANSAPAPWPFDPRINRGVSDFHLPHNLVLNFSYEVPFHHSLKTSLFMKTLLAGWQVGGIYTRQSGGPFTLRITGDRALTGNSQANGNQAAPRPDYVNAPGCSPNAVTGDIANYIRTQCFAYPALGTLGNLGRNTLRMPTFRDLDFSVFKNQNVWGERLKAQFRIEMFNVLNHTNLAAQTLTIFDGSGNLISNVTQPRAPTINTSRQIQLGLRLIF